MKPNYLDGKSVLVTGSTGLAGSVLARRLTRCGAELFLVGRTPPNEMPPNAVFVQADFKDGRFLERLPGRVDSVVHLAQSRLYKQFPQHAADIFETNIAATYKLLDYARYAGVENFVYTSSGGLYQPDSCPVDEESPLRDFQELDAYYLSKLTSELLVNRYEQIFRCVIFRPFTLYGPNQQAHQMIPQLLNRVKQGMSVYLRGENGEFVRPLHAQDLSDAIISAIGGNASGVFNISGPEIMTVRELAGQFSEYFGVSPKFEVRADEPLTPICSNRKLNELYEPRIRLRTSILDIAQIH